MQTYIGISAISAYVLSVLLAEKRAGEAALIEARDDAEKANAAKSDFLASMSHELRTPLNAILGFSEAIERETFGATGDKRYQEYATHIHEAGRHLLKMINGMMDYYEIQSGKVELQRKTRVIAPLVEEIASFGKVLAERRNNRLTFSIAENLGEAKIDSTLTRQVLLNVLGNAIKYTDDGDIDLTAHRESRSNGQSRPEELVFVISDTGPGISKDILARVFQPFDRGDPLLADRRDGIGLGLTITKDLCRIMGGEVQIDTVPGEGSTVTIRIPVE